MDSTKREATGVHRIDGERQPLASADVLRYESDLALTDVIATTIVYLTGEGRRVLELGSSSGPLLRILRSRGCAVTRIEVDAAAAAGISAHCDRVIVGDLDFLDFDTELGDTTYDRIVAADILHRVKDPVTVLHKLRKFLKPDGLLVASVTNIAHASVRLALLNGRFPYGETGLLEKTHLRFFTRESLLSTLSDAGFVVMQLERQRKEADIAGVPAEIMNALQSDEDAQTYRFIVAASPAAQRGNILQDRMNRLTMEHESLQQRLDHTTVLLDQARADQEQIVAERGNLAVRLEASQRGRSSAEADAWAQKRRADVELETIRTTVTAQAEMIGRLEAEVTDLRLVIDEDAAAARSLQRELASARDAIAAATRAEQLLRLELQRYMTFVKVVERSRGWKFIQLLRQLVGRRW
jgi:2-polyprenyl-3-methyl-5-hydroxy-6-metoxy-1,4-benzoquinol methylase